MKGDLIEIKGIGNGYMLVQKNGKGQIKKIIGKKRNRKSRKLLSSS